MKRGTYCCSISVGLVIVWPAVAAGVGVVLLLREADLLWDGELDAAAVVVAQVEGALEQDLLLLDELRDGRAQHHLLLPALGLGLGDALDQAVVLDFGDAHTDRHVNLGQVGDVVAVLGGKIKTHEGMQYQSISPAAPTQKHLFLCCKIIVGVFVRITLTGTV